MMTPRAIPLAIVVAMLMGGIARPASAVPVTITNPSFEADVINTINANVVGISFWTTDNGNGGVWRPGATYYPGGVPAGVNAAYEDGGTISQTLSATLANTTTYTLKVAVGHRADRATLPNYTIGLLAGTTVLTSALNPIDPGAGLFGYTTLIYTSTASDPIGQALGIRFFTSAGQLSFDDVTLDASPVPEPGTLALLGVSLTALGIIRRRRAA